MATISNKQTQPRRLATSPTPIARGATARSAVSPRVSSALASTTRRPSSKAGQLTEDAREALVVSLKQETDHKEQLLVQVQEKDQTIAALSSEIESLNSTLHQAETRLNELYSDQARSETELSQRIEVAEKLRTQVRELEREKRDLQRRYNEQTATFEAERQAIYDNEQHLKSRIQSLSEALKRAEEAAKQLPEPEPETTEDPLEHPQVPKSPVVLKQDLNDPESEPAEMTALKLELSTLSTSYSSLQSTLVLLQSQLLDLKRVNNEIQEENESYMILLREKTLTGQFDLMRQVGTSNMSEDDSEDDGGSVENTDVGSLRSLGRSTLDRVDEEVEVTGLGANESSTEDSAGLDDELDIPRFSRHSSRQGRKRSGSMQETRGESLANLPITGPGLDLAAELGRAENKDNLDGTIDDQGPFVNKNRRNKKLSDSRKVSGSDSGGQVEPTSTEVESMRSEIKSLKDANKALSLYASKIIDRIIAQEGFEHVLAADYENESETPSVSNFSNSTKPSPALAPKARPVSVFVGRATTTTPAPDSRFASPNSVSSLSSTTSPSRKANRRSLSFDWKNFSIFNSTAEKKPDANLRPLTLKPGQSTLPMARKLDTEEDEEDRKERERLAATMKLMGIQPSIQTPPLFVAPTSPPPIGRSQSDNPVMATSNRRFSLFGFKSSSTDNSSDKASVHSTPALGGSTQNVGLGINLTQEALEHAEAENTLASLDAHERNLTAELAKGGSGGFTEIVPRPGRRRRSEAGGGSGSTVWSAGMSAEND